MPGLYGEDGKRRSFHKLARAVISEFDQVLGLTSGIFDAKDFAEGHLLERETNFCFLRKILQGGLSIINQPIYLKIAIAGHRLIAGNREVIELDKHRGISLDRKTEDFDVEPLGCFNVCHVFQNETEFCFNAHNGKSSSTGIATTTYRQ